MKKYRGGLGLTPQIFNNVVNELQDKLNALQGDNFRYPIDKDKMEEDTLGRVDVSSRGGASKVLELDYRGYLRLRPDADTGTNIRIGNGSADNVTFDFSNRALKFYANSVNSVTISYAGWS